MAANQKKSYEDCLASIPCQLRRSYEQEHQLLSELFTSVAHNGAFLIGSGGSLTSAYFYAHLFEKLSGIHCPVMTPLELICSPIKLQKTRCVFFSAEGKNPDIIQAFMHAHECSAPITCVTNFSDTLLGEQCQQLGHQHVLIPAIEKDGFLAIHTIIATVAAGYGVFNQLIAATDMKSLEMSINGLPHQPIDTKNLVIVYSPLLKSAAIDIESRFNESGVANVQMTDIRNFSHGRHYGAYLHKQDTHVVILADKKTSYLGRLTQLSICESIPTTFVKFTGSDAEVIVKAIIYSMHLLWAVALTQPRDPNKVDVPKFGRALYYLPYRKEMLTDETWQVDNINVPAHYMLKKFDAVVFDYDGTLCDSEERYQPLKPIVGLFLERLLRQSVKVGIATGRGKSAGEELRLAINPLFWNQIIVGYYNGSIIETLDTELDVNQYSGEHHIEAAFELIEELKISDIEIKKRPTQITIKLLEQNMANEAVSIISKQLRSLKLGLKIVRSSHSIDIVGKNTSKLSVVKKMNNRHECLTVGDSGQADGNDRELLSHPYSISVNHPTGESDRGLKIGATSEIELNATLRLFASLRVEGGYFRINSEEV